MAPHPASINTNMQYTTTGQPMGAPPGYGMQAPAPHGMAPGIPQPQYGVRNPAVEVEGAGRSKSQLIVGIDFGTTFSGVAFAFATNNEAREDIITEWPGAGTYTKQKVRWLLRLSVRCLMTTDPNRVILRSVPESCGLGARYR